MRMKVCRKSGCNNAIPYNQKNPYCTVHAFLYKPNHADVTKHVKRDTSYYDKYKRDKESAAFYQSKIWEHTARTVKAKSFFTCAICDRTYDKPGYLVTDHIVPLKIDRRRCLDPQNLWVLCKGCHYWKTQLEEKIYTSQSRIENIDVSTKWTRSKISEWVLAHKKIGGPYVV